MKYRKFLTACGNGMGTSMMIRIKLENVLSELGVEDFVVESSSASVAQSLGAQYDVVLLSSNLAEDISFPNSNVKVIGLQNIMDEAEMKAKLSALFAADE